MESQSTHNTRKRFLYKKRCAIRGAIFEAYREMGSGFLESVYQECFVKRTCFQKYTICISP